MTTQTDYLKKMDGAKFRDILSTVDRVRGTGPSGMITLRLKANAFDSIDRRRAELEMTRQDYVRWLLTKDVGIQL